METISAFFRRHAARCHGYEPIARHEEEEEDLEARGDRFMARGHRRGSRRWFVSSRHQTCCAAIADFKEAAFSYAKANANNPNPNWRKAAAACDNVAVHALEVGFSHDAAHALLSSARCYEGILHKHVGEVAATESALHKALELFIKVNELQSAATCCMKLGEFYMERKGWQNARHFFLKARDYYGNVSPDYAFYCDRKALLAIIMYVKERLEKRD